MSRIGRNDPCPCGSGRKYKKCCGSTASGAAISPEDQGRAWEALRGLLDAPGFASQRADAEGVFFAEGPGLADLPSSGMVEMADGAFWAWLAFDWRLLDGWRPVDHLLAGSALGPGERTYLQRLATARMRAYEVVAVRPGEWVTLREILDRGTVTVRERLASQSLRRFQILAARVNPLGPSGGPELDGGVFLLSPEDGAPGLAMALRYGLDEWRQEHPDLAESEFWATMPPRFYGEWTRPLTHRPQLQTTDGEEMALAASRFAVLDRDRLVAALEAADGLERQEDGESYRWSSPLRPDGTSVLWGTFRLQGEFLLYEGLSRERAARAQQLLEQIAPGTVHHRATQLRDPWQAALEQADRPTPKPVPHDDALDQFTAAHLEAYYRRWVDEPVPALDGATPRVAARSSTLRPRLVALLEEFELAYQRALGMDAPGYDPTPLWEELGLAEEPDAPGSEPGPLPVGAEALIQLLPELGDLAVGIATRLRARADFDLATVVGPEELSRDLAVQRFLRGRAEAEARRGVPPEDAVADANLLGEHLAALVNWELYHRKTFWVEESLAWQLDHTTLDLEADLLRPPFAAFAVAFDDRHTLGLGERLLGQEPGTHRGRILKVLTAHVTQVPRPHGRMLRLAFTFDARDGQWPYLVGRDLWLEPGTRLDAILDSRAPDVRQAPRDPFFTSPRLRRLVHLVINAILYATSPGVAAADGGREEPRTGKKPPVTAPRSEHVFRLPGRIPISRLRQLQSVERCPGGGSLMHRFLVRGHWRRATPKYKDQRPRWIEPYWKGPDLALVIEREYQLVP